MFTSSVRLPLSSFLPCLPFSLVKLEGADVSSRRSQVRIRSQSADGAHCHKYRKMIFKSRRKRLRRMFRLNCSDVSFFRNF